MCSALPRLRLVRQKYVDGSSRRYAVCDPNERKISGAIDYYGGRYIHSIYNKNFHNEIDRNSRRSFAATETFYCDPLSIIVFLFIFFIFLLTYLWICAHSAKEMVVTMMVFSLGIV